MIKDYLPNTRKKPGNGLRSVNNPTGRNRKNRLDRDFDSDISIARDQILNRNRENNPQQGPIDPHEYLKE